MAITEHGLAAEAVARPQRWRRGDAPTVALHWLVALLLLVSLATGFRVAADALEAGWWRGVAARIAPQGAVLLWHIASACALLAAAAGYVTFLVRARQVGRVRLDARRRAGLRSPDARRRWKAVNVLIYWLAFGLVFAAGTTGLLMYSDLVNRAEWHLSHLHRWIAFSLAGYVVLHVSAQLALDGWRALYAILVPRRSFGVAAAAAGAALALAAVGVLTIDWLTVRTLAVGKVQDVPRIDGAFDDPAWQDAQAVTIETAGGANLFSGGTTVTVRAVHDDTDAYFLFEWRDPTRSLTHLPLQKTAAGWRMVQNGFYRADETDFYEDKFAVMLSNADRFAALRATHLGPRPVETLPGASGQRGLHYTDDWSVLDVWHWMAVRTDPLGQAEDDYFGPLRLPSDSPLDRYAGGYAPDPGAAAVPCRTGGICSKVRSPGASTAGSSRASCRPILRYSPATGRSMSIPRRATRPRCGCLRRRRDPTRPSSTRPFPTARSFRVSWSGGRSRATAPTLPPWAGGATVCGAWR